MVIAAINRSNSTIPGSWDGYGLDMAFIAESSLDRQYHPHCTDEACSFEHYEQFDKIVLRFPSKKHACRVSHLLLKLGHTLYQERF